MVPEVVLVMEKVLSKGVLFLPLVRNNVHTPMWYYGMLCCREGLCDSAEDALFQVRIDPNA